MPGGAQATKTEAGRTKPFSATGDSERPVQRLAFPGFWYSLNQGTLTARSSRSRRGQGTHHRISAPRWCPNLTRPLTSVVPAGVATFDHALCSTCSCPDSGKQRTGFTCKYQVIQKPARDSDLLEPTEGCAILRVSQGHLIECTSAIGDGRRRRGGPVPVGNPQGWNSVRRGLPRRRGAPAASGGLRRSWPLHRAVEEQP